MADEETVVTGTQNDGEGQAGTGDGQSTADSGAGEGGAGSGESYFLEVDDRTKYRDAESAKKGFQEAGRRIGELSRYEQIVKDYGLNGPDDLEGFFNGYLEEQANAGTQTRTEAAHTQSLQTAVDKVEAGEPLNDADKAALTYFQKKILPQLGLPSKQQLQEVQERIEAITQSVQGAESRTVNAMIDQGKSHLATLMSAEKYPVEDQNFVLVVEDAIKSWLENSSRYDQKGTPLPGSPLSRFFQGGDAQRRVVEEGFNRVKGAFSLMKGQGAGNYQAAKDKTKKVVPKPLPAGSGSGAAKTSTLGSQTGAKRTGAGIISPDIHERAYQLFRERSGQGANEQ